MEIAEQFVALATNCSPEARAAYTVTGVVNAPVLAAAMVQTNGPWIELAKQLGKLSAKLSEGIKPGVKINVITSGEFTEFTIRYYTLFTCPLCGSSRKSLKNYFYKCCYYTQRTILSDN